METGFYTVADGNETETLCASCALPIVNSELMAAGHTPLPLPSMADAAAIEAAVQALVGAPGYTLAYSTTGTCGACGVTA